MSGREQELEIGQAYHPSRFELDAFTNESQRDVEGEYRIKLYKGT